MFRKILVLLLVINLLAENIGYAQVPNQQLSLSDAFIIALKNNLDYQAVQAGLNVADARILTARTSHPNPSIITDNAPPEKTYRIGVEQTILLGGDRQKRIALASAEQNVFRAEIQTTALELRADVRQAYTQFYSAQQRVQAYEQLWKLAEQLLDIAQKREKAGDIATVDVLQVRMLALEAKNNFQTARYVLIQAGNRFNILLNQPLENDITLLPPNETPVILVEYPEEEVGVTVLNQDMLDTETLIEKAFLQRPELQRNAYLKEATLQQAALARALRIPDLTLGAGTGLVTNDKDEWVPDLYLTAAIEVPIFNRQQGTIAEAKAREAQLKKEALALQNRIRLEISNALNAYRLNKDRIERYENEILPTAKLLVEKARRAFEEGKTSVLFPVNAQETVVKTQLDYLKALQDYQTALANLEQAIGSKL